MSSRERAKKAWPTDVILDTQSAKNAATATGTTIGFDAGTLVEGHNRLVLTNMYSKILVIFMLQVDSVIVTAAIAFWDEVATLHEQLG